jgi:glutamine synthetase
LNLKDTPSALATVVAEKNLALFERAGVLSRREMQARSTIFFRKYSHRVNVEANSMYAIASTSILPAAVRYQHELASSITAALAAAPKLDVRAQSEMLEETATQINKLRAALARLEAEREKCEHVEGDLPQAQAYRDRVAPAMVEVRTHCDRLETLVDDQLWPLPKYRELLFLT